jgi:hypothetical protein
VQGVVGSKRHRLRGGRGAGEAGQSGRPVRQSIAGQAGRHNRPGTSTWLLFMMSTANRAPLPLDRMTTPEFCSRRASMIQLARSPACQMHRGAGAQGAAGVVVLQRGSAAVR